jgi:hypothetical protein
MFVSGRESYHFAANRGVFAVFTRREMRGTAGPPSTTGAPAINIRGYIS